ncbi:histidine phosphatase family protein [Alteromonadaceae bacterium BrNp21-10]|nr:histidine phosphatase family protein [Alteromonadaceae bacterium BrNp21-10]
MKGRLYVCRHGQSEWNLQGKLQGQLDSDLTQLGRLQAQQLSDKARHWQVTKVVSSVLGRASHSAKICADLLQLNCHSVEGLEERHFGDWQGQWVKQVSGFNAFKQHCYQQLDLVPAISGESSAEVIARMKRALISLATQNPNSNTLVISHGDALSCLMTQWGQSMALDNTQGIQLSVENNRLHWGGFID